MLQSVDISGAVRLGNDGSLKVLQACGGVGMFNNVEVEGVTSGRVCLKGCGMESPLPSELIEMLKDKRDGAVDISGNKIDNRDKLLLMKPW